jgi:hypothetical protein
MERVPQKFASPKVGAWMNYRGRILDTIAGLRDNLEDIDDQSTRDHITALIKRHEGYVQFADERITRLSGNLEHPPTLRA